MSLLGTLQIANNSLIAMQVGLQVVGNNIANASTPGYTRQEVIYTPAPTQSIGTLTLGLGVQIEGIIQRTDRFVGERLRSATSDLSNTGTQKQIYLQLESILGELTETDLSSSLNRFFSAINDVVNQPEDPAVRNLAVLQGESLSSDFQRLNARVRQIRSDANELVVAAADDINRLLEEIANLNVQIVSMEGTSTTASEAGGLRDQRDLALGELAKLIAIRTAEQPHGSVTVFAGGDYLVLDGNARPVGVAYEEDRALSVATIQIVDSDAPLEASSGQLAGAYTARDEILGSFLDELDAFSRDLMFEFNKVFSGGQGMTGFSTVTGTYEATDTDAPLDQAGLDFTPVNGSFQVQVRNKRTDVTTTTDIEVDLNGLDHDTTLESLTAALDAVDGISAQIDSLGRLRLAADSAVLEFAFANDTSGALAALGINTFFTGSMAGDMGVNATLKSDPSKFTASDGGIAANNNNAVALAGLATARLESLGERSLTEEYERFAGATFQASASIQAIHEGFDTFHKTLEGQHLGISGVNIDEQAVKMIQYQRMYQASARLISTINELLEMIVTL
ncbi:MAG: flagellar hook-associated protein FlgK [Pirellulaceae bacterium]